MAKSAAGCVRTAARSLGGGSGFGKHRHGTTVRAGAPEARPAPSSHRLADYPAGQCGHAGAKAHQYSGQPTR